MRFLKYIAISWTLWGISLYLFSPYLTILLESSISIPFLVDLTYIISSIAGILFINLLKVFRDESIAKISIVVSGLGLIILGLSNNAVSAILGLLTYNTYWIAVPFFYYNLSKAEKEQFSKTWAISMIPALILPIVGGLISLHIGVRAIFIISGVLMILSAVPLTWVKFNIEGEGRSENRESLIPLIFSVLPLSLALPFLYELRSFELSTVWLTYEIGEVVGILLTWISWRNNNSLAVALLIFSTVIVNSFVALGGFYYGLSEAVLSSGVGSVNPRSFKTAIRVATMEASLWTIGYIMSSLAYIVNYSLPFVYAGLIALLFALLIMVRIENRRVRIPSLREIYLSVSRRVKHVTYEGIDPYFKFA